MLRPKADFRSLLYVMLTSSVLVAQWQLGELNWVLFPLSLYLAASVAVMAHNHVPMWRRRSLNVLTD